MIQALWDYAKTDFASFIGDFSLITLVLGGLFFWLRAYFTNSFQKKLESHKGLVNSELETHKGAVNSKIEEVKHNQQKVFKEFDLYTTKMHEVYPELYKKMEYAYGEVLNLRGVILAPDLRRFNQEEFDEHLDDLQNLSKTEIASLSSKFSNNKEEAIQELHQKMEWVRYHKANIHLAEANNFFIVNELYLTDEASNASREVLKLLRNYHNDLNPNYNGDRDVVSDRRDKRDKLPGVKDSFREILKKDLKRSFTV
ncbi:hypothetical protein [Paenibacillus pabuli]|uniref:hypothetical protein n=1 Tax=Paenibacillus pabuli TaxID=1472 RepID=UPI001FFF8831|nr:hypothetical protein [Paenibacillus pabuli]UPK45868.1 hypothetical protein KET34_10620 [Paenibacillus pabuli]